MAPDRHLPESPARERSDLVLGAGAVVATAAAGATHYLHSPAAVPFVVSAVALGVLAALVGRGVDRLGNRLGSGATGAVQAAFGNLPELLFGIFALRAGLVGVLQAALVGSVLANVLLVLGTAFMVGGLRHGTQRFAADAARNMAVLLLLAVAVLVVPTVALRFSGAAAHHSAALSDVAAVVLLAVFVLSLPGSLVRRGPEIEEEGALWPLPVALGVLAAASIAAGFVADWFVASLRPALSALHISAAFAGLVIVAIAGNAVEHVVGIQLAARDRVDYALSVILQSPLQIALALFPALVLLSGGLGPVPLTLELSPLLAACLAVAAVVAMAVVVDGESTWLEGTCLVGLYVVIASAFWWG